MIDEIKETLEKEDMRCVDSTSFKTTANMRAGVLHLLNHPEEDEGLPLLWKNVDLVLKPEMYVVTGIPSSGKSTWLDNSEIALCFVSISGGPVLAATHESSS